MYKRIVVAVDGSKTSNLALDAAIALARAFEGRVRLVHVLDESVWLSGLDVYGGAAPELYDAMRRWGDQLLSDHGSMNAAASTEDRLEPK